MMKNIGMIILWNGAKALEALINAVFAIIEGVDGTSTEQRRDDGGVSWN